jgi:HD superfamily phosphodiesterase
MTNDYENLVEKFVKNKYDNDEYNWKHNEFVTKKCIELGKILGGDLELLRIAARLHDIDYSRGKDYHTEDSANFSYKFLIENGYPKNRAEMIKIIILCHSNNTLEKIKEPPLEGKILYDSDKMWTLTPIGFARTIAHRYKKNSSFEFTIKCLNKQIKNMPKLFFEESRQMVKEDYKICEDFLKSINKF